MLLLRLSSHDSDPLELVNHARSLTAPAVVQQTPRFDLWDWFQNIRLDWIEARRDDAPAMG